MHSPDEEGVITCLKGIPEKRLARRERSLHGRSPQEAGYSRHSLYCPSTSSGLEPKGGIEHQRIQNLGHSPCDPNSTAETESSHVQQSGTERVLLMKRYHLTPRYDV